MSFLESSFLFVSFAPIFGTSGWETWDGWEGVGRGVGVGVGLGGGTMGLPEGGEGSLAPSILRGRLGGVWEGGFPVGSGLVDPRGDTCVTRLTGGVGGRDFLGTGSEPLGVGEVGSG